MLTTTRCANTGNDELLEIVRQAVIAAFEKRAGLRRALQHQQCRAGSRPALSCSDVRVRSTMSRA